MVNQDGDLVLSVAYIFLSVIAILANLLIIVATLRSKRLRSCTTMLVCNLSASDLVLVIMNIPYRASRYLKYGGYDQADSCRMAVYIQIMTSFVSNSSLFLVTLDRYIGVHYPLHYITRVTRRKTKVAILLSILISFVTTGGVLTANKLIRSQSQGLVVQPQGLEICIFSTVLETECALFIEIGIFVIPLLVTVVLYVQIVKTIYTAKKNMRFNSSSASTYSAKDGGTSVIRHNGCMDKMKSHLRELKTAKLVCVQVTIYVVFILPIVVLDGISSFADINISFVVFQTALFIAHCFPVSNPLIYGILNPRYREAIRDGFRWCRITPNG